MTAKKVLIVEDSSAIRMALASMLKAAGYEVVEAVDGHAGKAMIAATDDISVVLCDINMPGMGGLEMLAEIKQEPRHAALPIVMLTTEGESKLMQRAKTAGARGWIVKPCKAEQLVATVRRLAG
jgi:two-component system, chemotaxis family, chemotaxis protein CheY